LFTIADLWTVMSKVLFDTLEDIHFPIRTHAYTHTYTHTYIQTYVHTRTYFGSTEILTYIMGRV